MSAEKPSCQLYLISPLDVSGAFPERLARALDAGPVAAFQFRVKDVDQHEAARLAEPLQAICRAREVAFIVNDSVALAKRPKASEHRPEPELLTWWQGLMEIPCVAIGGITPDNCGPLVEAGADFLAVSGAVWNGDAGEAVRAFAKVLK